MICSVRRSVPASRWCVANECRNVCGVTRLLMPARRAASRQTAAIVPRGDRVLAVLAEEEVILRRLRAPVLTQDRKQDRRQRNEAVLRPLPVTDMDHHALAVDVTHPKPSDLRDAKASRVRRQQHRQVLDVADAREQLLRLRPAQNHRQRLLLPGERDVPDVPVPLQRRSVQEPQGTHGGVERRPAHLPLLDQVDLVRADLLQAELARATAVVDRELLDAADVRLLRLESVVANSKVFEHPLAKCSHWAPFLVGGCRTSPGWSPIPPSARPTRKPFSLETSQQATATAKRFRSTSPTAWRRMRFAETWERSGGSWL